AFHVTGVQTCALPILALDMIAEVQRRFGVRISPLDILMSTLEQLAAKIEHEAAALGDELDELLSNDLEPASMPAGASRKQGIIRSEARRVGRERIKGM